MSKQPFNTISRTDKPKVLIVCLTDAHIEAAKLAFRDLFSDVRYILWGHNTAGIRVDRVFVLSYNEHRMHYPQLDWKRFLKELEMCVFHSGGGVFYL